jgi:hypothetical protein
MKINHLTCCLKLRISITLLLVAVTGLCTAQSTATAGNLNFEKKYLKTAKYEMACFVENEGKQVEISTLSIDINPTAKDLSIITTVKFVNADDLWIDTSIADGNTFKPVYRSSFNKNRELRLNYENEVTGYHYDKKSRKRSVIKEPITETYVDSYAYPYLVAILPLTSGYNTNLPVYEFKGENANNIINTRIEEVKSNVHTSKHSGTHKVWEVSVLEGGTNDRYVYSIDKDTRRVWKIEIFTKSQHLTMLDKETNFTPFKSTFDKVATLALIKSGSAAITGQAFARDNENEGLGSNIAIFNVNKKQFAPVGTGIVLIPHTDYFKEWIKVNEASRKKGAPVPLPQDAFECIKVATVYDDKGHFEFVNLMPGEYLLFVEFGYTHTSRRNEVVGYTDHYVGGLFQGTSTNMGSRSYASNASASIKKIVTIEKEGEKVEIKLKKTN